MGENRIELNFSPGSKHENMRVTSSSPLAFFVDQNLCEMLLADRSLVASVTRHSSSEMHCT